MATYTLSGTGTQPLSANVVALHITITTLPSSAGLGRANPADHYGVGLLRPGDGTGFWDAYPISGGPQWIPLPWSVTVLGYILFDGAVVQVAEVFAPAPLAFPLASLPDVAIGSPADTQVLTYQAASAKWINAAAPGGGGGGTNTGDTLIQQQILSAASATVNFNAIPATYTHLRLWLLVRATGGNAYQELHCTINNDVTANSYTYVVWDNTGQANGTAAFSRVCYVAGGSSAAGMWTYGLVTFPFYAVSGPFKGFTSDVYVGSLERHGVDAGRSSQTGALASLQLMLDANTLAVGSTFRLMGVQ